MSGPFPSREDDAQYWSQFDDSYYDEPVADAPPVFRPDTDEELHAGESSLERLWRGDV